MVNRTGTYFAFDGLGEADPTKSDFKYYDTTLNDDPENNRNKKKIALSKEEFKVAVEKMHYVSNEESLLRKSNSCNLQTSI